MSYKDKIEMKPGGSGRSETIDLKKVFHLFSRKWPVLVGSFLLAFIGGYFYYSSTSPVYRITSSVLIEEGERAGLAGTNQLLQGFGLLPGAQNLDNQIQLLLSWRMIERAINELSFQFDCYNRGMFKKVSYFPIYPIEVNSIPGHVIPYDIEYNLKFKSNSEYILSTRDFSFFAKDTVGRFGRRLDFLGSAFRIQVDPAFLKSNVNLDRVSFKFISKEALIEHFKERLKIDLVSRDGTMIILSLEGTNKSRDILFLDKLTEVFIASNLEQKNHEAERIIAFIDEQLIDVSDSLRITETRLQEFRSRNKIMNISAQAQQIVDQAVLLENEKARLTLESNYYEYLSEYLANEDVEEVPIAPATMGIDDPLLSILMQDLASLQAEYFSSGVGARNPLQAQLELRIRNTKQSIRETLEGIKKASNMAIDENESQIRAMNYQAARLPVKERQLLGIEREFNLNNVLYTFLLERRAEAQLQMASNKADNEIVDYSRPDKLPVSPDKLAVLIVVLLLGVAMPMLIILLLNYLSNVINTENDLKQIANLPVAGHIPHSRLGCQTVVLSDPQSQVAEAFRNFRARIEFLIQDKKCPVILVSSSIPGEGKTFASVNIASAYSLSGHKTVLIGFDLRVPAFSKDFELNESKGISTYLIGKHTLNGIIQKTNYDNLYIIPAGPIPPNPFELINSPKTEKMINELKKSYEYIIIDSAPIGTVSDGYKLATLADTTILMIRNGKTLKRPLVSTLEEMDDFNIDSKCLLINDIKANKNSYAAAYRYQYSYKKKS